jgi:hypothetical protein
MLDATPTMALGAATIFTGLPPTTAPSIPGVASLPFLTPSDAPQIINNLVGPTSTSDPQTPPDVAAGSPASTQPLVTNRGWSLALTRNPSIYELLQNKQAYTTDGTQLIPYSGAYPDSTFYGPQIDPTTFKTVGTPGTIGTYTPNAGNPNAFGPLSFRTNLQVNTSSDGQGFGAPNKPFTTTPTELFALQSTAEYLDYRPDRGNPNGGAAVTVEALDPSGTWQSVTTTGLIPYYSYSLPGNVVTSTNSYSIPNSPDLSVSVMDLSHKNPDGTFSDPTGVDAGNLQILQTSDYAATMGWGTAASGQFQVTMASGSPFAQFTFTPGTAVTDPQTLLIRNGGITGFSSEPIQDTATVYPDLNAIEITAYSLPDTSGMKIITDPAADPTANSNLKVKTFYAVYFPAGTPLATLQSIADGMNYLPNTKPIPVNPLFGQGADNILIDLPAGLSATNPFHFLIAALPNDNATTMTTFQKYAFNYITGTQGNFAFDPATSQVTETLTETTQNVDPQSIPADGTLLVTYANQYKFLDPDVPAGLFLPDPSMPGTLLTMPSVYGTSRLLAAPTAAGPGGTETTTMNLRLTYQGSLSILPPGAFVSTDPQDKPSATPAELAQEIQNIESQLTDINANQVYNLSGQGITYNWGQELNLLATLIPIADQLGQTAERGQLIELVKSEMTQWFNASTTLNQGANQVLGYDPSSGVPQFLYYDKQWDALIGYAAGFGTDTGLNDLHYTWGYWVRAASVVATYDPSFIASYGPMIDFLIQNVANYDRSSKLFPYLRVFNPYDGHSWAAGVYPVADGDNEESASEAIDFYSAMIAWGNLEMAAAAVQNTSDPTFATGLAMRNTGISLETFEISAFQQYWLNADGDTFPPLTRVTYGGNTYYAGGYIQRYSYAGLDGTKVNPPAQWQNEIYASDQFLLSRGLVTFFLGANAAAQSNGEGQLAITVLPFGPQSLYLGRTVQYTTNPTNGDASQVRDIPQELYDRYIAQQNTVYGNPVPGQQRPVPLTYPGTIWDYQALFDPQGALARWNGVGNYIYDFPANAARAARDRRLHPLRVPHQRGDARGHLLFHAVLQQVRPGQRHGLLDRRDPVRRARPAALRRRLELAGADLHRRERGVEPAAGRAFQRRLHRRECAGADRLRRHGDAEPARRSGGDDGDQHLCDSQRRRQAPGSARGHGDEPLRAVFAGCAAADTSTGNRRAAGAPAAEQPRAGSPHRTGSHREVERRVQLSL